MNMQLHEQDFAFEVSVIRQQRRVLNGELRAAFLLTHRRGDEGWEGILLKGVR